MRIVIPLMCRPKKNSQQIFINSKTKKPFITQNQKYKEFEKECSYYLIKYKNLNINKPINLKCIFYVNDKRKRDLINLEQAIADILVKYGVLEDDNYNIIQSWDGSRIIYDKNKEETIIEISDNNMILDSDVI